MHSLDNSESRTNDHIYCDDGSQSHRSGTSASSIGGSMNNILSYISITDIDLTPGDSVDCKYSNISVGAAFLTA